VNPALLSGAALLGLFGSHSVDIPVVTTLADRTCANTLDLSRPTALSYPGKENEIDANIDAAAPCVKTAAGAALYRTFQLPESAASYVITVSSEPFGSAILAPRVLLLAQDGAVKREFAGSDLMFHGSTLSARFRSHPDEAYLVVESDAGVIGGAVSRISENTTSSMMSTGQAIFAIYQGRDETRNLVYSHTGPYTVTLEPVPQAK
jgi:hypothetical protein